MSAPKSDQKLREDIGEVDPDGRGDLFGETFGLASGPGSGAHSTDRFRAADGALGGDHKTGVPLHTEPAPKSVTAPLRYDSQAHLVGAAPRESGSEFIGVDTGLPGSGFQTDSGTLPLSAESGLDLPTPLAPQVGNTPGYEAQTGFGSATVADKVQHPQQGQ
eukprot:TRINITY_DN11549_c0_g1_i1.p1 TRINITY_DN11549_c0_g1~~TRINITY_DN11549_c0_g1_i1.p1  ORF type:complete len:162 (-),score=52.03 TRINITY_DN11549_c0_g1_i1:59-544(-)